MLGQLKDQMPGINATEINSLQAGEFFMLLLLSADFFFKKGSKKIVDRVHTGKFE